MLATHPTSTRCSRSTIGGATATLRVCRRPWNTPLSLGVRDDGDLVAAACVLTDYTYYPRMYDVIVREDRRGEGLGGELLFAVVEHPRFRT